MNMECLNCRNLRTEARVMPGSAVSMFFCPYRRERAAYLHPGERLRCHEQRTGELVDRGVTNPDYAERPR